MFKGIELTQSQIKAYENGATMFLIPITLKELKNLLIRDLIRILMLRQLSL